MSNNDLKKRLTLNLESLGERLGRHVSKVLSKDDDKRAATLGRSAGQKLGRQVERLHELFDKENVTKEEQLGIGGKIGTGLGIIGKELLEKRPGALGDPAGPDDLVSQGRTVGAKAEKILKKTLKKGINRISGRIRGPDEDKPRRS